MGAFSYSNCVIRPIALRGVEVPQPVLHELLDNHSGDDTKKTVLSDGVASLNWKKNEVQVAYKTKYTPAVTSMILSKLILARCV